MQVSAVAVENGIASEVVAGDGAHHAAGDGAHHADGGMLRAAGRCAGAEAEDPGDSAASRARVALDA
eukprot:5756904-Pleurochrysis_carterae.AAC.1